MSANPTALGDQIRAGDRRALAQAITLIESQRTDHREQATALLDDLLPATGGALRVAVTGTPGAGKSTFIETLGLRLTRAGRRVAVLAIDPSSKRFGGSILGDKTRMERLAREPAAFIRPSPSSGNLGGVARRTREASLLCEAAGFDVVIIETVGVGQSETAASEMVDCVLLVAAPGGGDDLQGIKRGIMELADVVVVNKADGDLALAAARTRAGLTNAIHLLRPKYDGWTVPVIEASSTEDRGIDEAWEAVESLTRHLERSGTVTARRGEQAVSWMWDEVRERLLDDFRDPSVRALVVALEDDVRSGARSAAGAAVTLLSLPRPSRGEAAKREALD